MIRRPGGVPTVPVRPRSLTFVVMPSATVTHRPRPLRSRRGLSAAVVRALTAVAVLAGLAWLAPQGLGGSAAYVVTTGNSMLPSHHAGGIVVVRTADDYEVGQVVAYRSPDMEAVVLHRIVDTEGDRFVLQGDNNDFRDSYRPQPTEILGKEWVHIPGAGGYVQRLRDPVLFAGVVAGITLLSLRMPRERRRRRRHHGA